MSNKAHDKEYKFEDEIVVHPDSGFQRWKKMTFGLGDGKQVFEKGTRVQLKFKRDVYGEINYFQTEVSIMSRFDGWYTLFTVCTRHHTIVILSMLLRVRDSVSSAHVGKYLNLDAKNTSYAM